MNAFVCLSVCVVICLSLCVCVCQSLFLYVFLFGSLSFLSAASVFSLCLSLKCVYSFGSCVLSILFCLSEPPSLCPLHLSVFVSVVLFHFALGCLSVCFSATFLSVCTTVCMLSCLAVTIHVSVSPPLCPLSSRLFVCVCVHVLVCIFMYSSVARNHLSV